MKATLTTITGTELAAIREAAGLTVTQAAARIGLHARTLARFEAGTRPIPLQTELALRWIAQQEAERRAALPWDGRARRRRAELEGV